jgi:hypothetical protein
MAPRRLDPPHGLERSSYALHGSPPTASHDVDDAEHFRLLVLADARITDNVGVQLPRPRRAEDAFAASDRRPDFGSLAGIKGAA